MQLLRIITRPNDFIRPMAYEFLFSDEGPKPRFSLLIQRFLRISVQRMYTFSPLNFKIYFASYLKQMYKIQFYYLCYCPYEIFSNQWNPAYPHVMT